MMNGLENLKSLASEVSYLRRQAESSLLYKVVQNNYEDTLSSIESGGRLLPHYIKNEFQYFLKCGVLENGLVRFHCYSCNHDRLVALSSFYKRRAQEQGSLNFNVHFHMTNQEILVESS